MTIRTRLGNTLIGLGRSVGQSRGKSELAVTISDHSIDARMEPVDKENRAWDSDLYHRGNVFIDGYANPIKPVVNNNKELEDPDTVAITEGGTDETQDTQEESEESHVQLISSPRYRDYMTQDLISQLLNPREQWKLLAWAILAVAFLIVINLVVTLSAAGVI